MKSAALKSVCWFRYVNDTVIIWNHGKQTFEDFLIHLSSHHTHGNLGNREGLSVTILDVMVCRKENGCIGHKVYRKLAHTDRNLNNDSNHHPRQKEAMIKLCSAGHNGSPIHNI